MEALVSRALAASCRKIEELRLARRYRRAED